MWRHATRSHDKCRSPLRSFSHRSTCGCRRDYGNSPRNRWADVPTSIQPTLRIAFPADGMDRSLEARIFPCYRKRETPQVVMFRFTTPDTLGPLGPNGCLQETHIRLVTTFSDSRPSPWCPVCPRVCYRPGVEAAGAERRGARRF